MPEDINRTLTQIDAAVGQLCTVWASVEQFSERTLSGIMGLNQEQRAAFIWRMPLVQRWQSIVREAKRKYPEAQWRELERIGKFVGKVQRDRNIVVHGIMHFAMASQSPIPIGQTRNGVPDQSALTRPPCWTIFIGEDAGKSFPISLSAIKMIIANAQFVQKLIIEYNEKNRFIEGTLAQQSAEENWPKPLQ